MRRRKKCRLIGRKRQTKKTYKETGNYSIHTVRERERDRDRERERVKDTET